MLSFEFREPSQVEIALGQNGKRVAVFCGSSSTVPSAYNQAAHRFGELLRESGCALVYGGGSWGMMGEVAKGASPACIVGVLPHFMLSTAGKLYGQIVAVQGMAERKAVINELTDVFIGLPGGFGTLDEVTEMLTWNQIGINNKLIGVLNTNGYYDDWWRWCQKAKDEGFIKEEHMRNLFVKETPEELVHEVLTRIPEEVPGKFRTRA